MTSPDAKSASAWGGPMPVHGVEVCPTCRCFGPDRFLWLPEEQTWEADCGDEYHVRFPVDVPEMT